MSPTVLLAASWFRVFRKFCGVSVQPYSCSFAVASKRHSELSVERQNNSKCAPNTTNNYTGNHQQHEKDEGGMSSVWGVAEDCIQNVCTENECTNSGRREDAHQHTCEESCKRGEGYESLGEHFRWRFFGRTLRIKRKRAQVDSFRAGACICFVSPWWHRG